MLSFPIDVIGTHGWAEMAGNHPCTNIGGQTFNIVATGS